MVHRDDNKDVNDFFYVLSLAKVELRSIDTEREGVQLKVGG